MDTIKNGYDFELIDKLNNTCFRGLEEYQIGSVLFWEIAINDKKQNHSIIRSVARILLSAFICKFSSTNNQSDFCFVYSDDYKGHDDYIPWFNNVGSLLENSNYIKVEKKRLTFKSVILQNSFQWVRRLRTYFNFKASVYYASALAKHYSDFIDIRNLVEKSNSKIITVLDSSHPTDNLITQYWKNTNIKTITLQHGIYTDVEHLLYTDNDYYLIYGQQTYELFEECHFQLDKLKIVGSPRLIGRKLKLNYKVKNNAIAVIFGAYYTEKDDLKMLDAVYSLSEKTGVKVIVKLHPGCTADEYPSGTFDKANRVIVNEMTVEEVMSEVDFATVTQSTVFVENLMNCKPTFVYDCKDCTPIYSKHKELLFGSERELEKLVDRTKSDSESMVKLFNEILNYYTITENVNGLYREFYRQLRDEIG